MIDAKQVTVGIAASPALDAKEWLQSLPLPPQWSAKQVDPQHLPRHLELLVWLWNPAASASELEEEKQRFEKIIHRAFRARGNRFLPVILLALNQQPGESGRESKQAWLKKIQAVLRSKYRKTLHDLVPHRLTDLSQIAWDASTENASKLLEVCGARLLRTSERWQHYLRRQARPFLKLGFAFTLIYLFLLLLTLSSRHDQPRPHHDPISWSMIEWKEKLKDCREFLASVQGKRLSQFSPSQLKLFAEHLRWLPLAADILQQPNRRNHTLQPVVQQVLQEMELLLKQEFLDGNAGKPAWIDSFFQTVFGTRWLILSTEQKLLLDTMENVFDPRSEKNIIHQVAEKFWQQERQLTIAFLQPIMLARQESANNSTPLVELCKAFLQERLTHANTYRIYAPPQQFAWLQELEHALAWCAMVQQNQQPFPHERTDPSIPLLIRESLPTQ